MVPENDDASGDASKKESRPPELKDIVALARELNSSGARYVVIGGIAMLQQGFTRATEDVDLLIDSTSANLDKVLQAVAKLPDHAAEQLSVEDFKEYEVIRVADEIVVDLMVRASGTDYSSAQPDIVSVNIEGVAIPFAKAELLLKMKQGVREKDVLDRKFLEQLIRGRGSK